MLSINIVIETLVVFSFHQSEYVGGQGCPKDLYFDPVTGECQPCSDCRPPHPLSENEFCSVCIKKCPQFRYYDPHTTKCEPCDDCKPPKTPNDFCKAQCSEDEIYGRTPSTGVAATTTPFRQLSFWNTPRIVAIVFGILIFLVVILLILLGIWKYRQIMRRKRWNGAGAHGERLANQAAVVMVPKENGERVMNGRGITDHLFANLPLHSSIDDDDVDQRRSFSGPSGVQPSSARNTLNIVHQNIVHQNIGTTTCDADIGNIQFPIDNVILVEEGDSSDSTVRLQSIAYTRGNSQSFLGNPICQPEQNERFCLQPSQVAAAEGPHLSWDHNKPNIDSEEMYHSGLTGQMRSPASAAHGGDSFSFPQTSLKTSLY